MEDVMLQTMVNWLWSVMYPVSQIDPIQRRWMERRRELRAAGELRR
jgi:hypothetical protein